MPVSSIISFFLFCLGVGKTTLTKKICERLRTNRIKIQGFYTEEKREHGSRIGFDVVSLDGKRGPLARITSQQCGNFPKVGKYAVDIQAFESIALPILNNLQGSPVLILDEIGKMELYSNKFKQKVSEIFRNSETVILATIPSRPMPVVDSLRKLPSAKIFTLSVQNRDDLEDEVMTHLMAPLATT
ncbi:unnamed protein product [Bemisia tabaci]|uniref:Nucleoside-triphosphatase THEP1 n=1 Tax=Bemisia tabaci TaxID=7038 RepID=A0AAI8Y5Y9_BEMTA|nr:PREDICTED: cancer-related nucleoside-triphosphatase homolog [Bemisia tabaci]CAH0746970.1 unnamed protein product [Bemisia tabaci]